MICTPKVRHKPFGVFYYGKQKNRKHSLPEKKKVIDDYFEETGIIKRMDFSLDLISYLDNDVKTKKLLISCVAIIRNISLECLNIPAINCYNIV